MLIEAGCKKWEAISIDPKNKVYRWVGRGTLLAYGACLGPGYQKHVEPEKGRTKVYTIIDAVHVREVSVMESTMSLDFELIMAWWDRRIRTTKGFIKLGTDAVAEIWKPDMFISNRKSPEWASLKDSILKDVLNPSLDSPSMLQTMVKTKYELLSTVYCNFDLANFPMDHHVCNFAFGSASREAIFVLYNPKNNSTQDPAKTYQFKTSNITYNFKPFSNDPSFDMSITYFDKKVPNGKNTVGFDVQMIRKLRPFILKYYVPCILIVCISGLSFVIPLTAIPGRVGLLATLFLTLTNLFINQMVSVNL